MSRYIHKLDTSDNNHVNIFENKSDDNVVIQDGLVVNEILSKYPMLKYIGTSIINEQRTKFLKYYYDLDNIPARLRYLLGITKDNVEDIMNKDITYYRLDSHFKGYYFYAFDYESILKKALDNNEDETDYLLSTKANREALLESIKDVKNMQDID